MTEAQTAALKAALTDQTKKLDIKNNKYPPGDFPGGSFLYESIAFQRVEKHPAAAALFVGCAAARHGDKDRKQKIEVLFARMDATEAPHGDLAGDAVLYSVLLMHISALWSSASLRYNLCRLLTL